MCRGDAEWQLSQSAAVLLLTGFALTCAGFAIG